MYLLRSAVATVTSTPVVAKDASCVAVQRNAAAAHCMLAGASKVHVIDRIGY